MQKQKTKDGMLSIESRNVFSILKKWLYTEQDIVFRELISNAADAIEKRSLTEEAAAPLSGAHPPVLSAGASFAGEIRVTLDPEENRLIISDNGIGMTVQELDQYINHIAFSGAEEFISKTQAGKDSIIGHFGVGFYSAFMLTDHVAIETKSCQDSATAVRWDCRSDMSFSMRDCGKQETGTDVILYLDYNSTYLKEPAKVLEIIKKYFIFSKTPVYFDAPGFDQVPANDPLPLWKLPKDRVQAAEMNAFYQEFFQDVAPLFWLQFASLDIGVQGILFFRNTKNGTEDLDGTIKVYSRGVYIGENIPELIPKFVNLQHGIIECDNLPLVVSRSSIREDEKRDDMNQLVYECLTQEVTIALNDMFVNQRESYEKHWPELNGFVKYGILQDKTFASVMARKVVFQDIYGGYKTIQEYAKDTSNTRPETVFYASDALDQAHYIEIFKNCGLNALLFDHVIDQPLMYRYEVMQPDLKFTRLDSNLEALFANAAVTEEPPALALLREKLTKALAARLGTMTIKFLNLEQEGISALIANDEQSRRMADMMEIYGLLNRMDDPAKAKQTKSTLMFNLNNDIVNFMLHSSDEAIIALAANQLLDLALMSQQALKPEDMEPFINRSEAILKASLGSLLSPHSQSN